MGNVMAVGPGAVPSPPMAAPNPSGVPPPPPSDTAAPPPAPPPQEPAGPGPFEELHKKTKELMPMNFEGCRVIINKVLSNHFQISHNVTMSSYAPGGGGYKFGTTFVDTKQFSPGEPEESSTVLIGEIAPNSDLNANIIHQLSKTTRCKLVSSIQKGRMAALQMSTEYLGADFSSAVTIANPDFLNGSGVMVAQYLRAITPALTAGAELMYQRDANMPGGQMAVYTLGARYAARDWQCSANFTPMAGAIHGCYFHKISEELQVGAEMECNPRGQEATGTLAFQLEIPKAAASFRGQLDSNMNVASVLEKRLPPLPCSLTLSAMANHQKNAYKFGIGFTIG